MTLGDHIKGELDSLGTLGTIIVGEVPAKPDAIGVIAEYGGRAGERQFGQKGIYYEKPSFQVLFRGDPHDYDTPMQKCLVAMRYLAQLQAITLNGVEFLTVDPQQNPFSLGKDENNRYEIVCNFWTEKRPD